MQLRPQLVTLDSVYYKFTYLVTDKTTKQQQDTDLNVAKLVTGCQIYVQSDKHLFSHVGITSLSFYLSLSLSWICDFLSQNRVVLVQEPLTSA
jgi:hypothetical protein